MPYVHIMHNGIVPRIIEWMKRARPDHLTITHLPTTNTTIIEFKNDDHEGGRGITSIMQLNDDGNDSTFTCIFRSSESDYVRFFSGSTMLIKLSYDGEDNWLHVDLMDDDTSFVNII